MKLNKGDKVKLTKKALTKILKYRSVLAKKLENIGVVVCEGNPYTKVCFSSIDKKWWISNRLLKPIIKNEQLLFEFMNKD